MKYSIIAFAIGVILGGTIVYLYLSKQEDLSNRELNATVTTQFLGKLTKPETPANAKKYVGHYQSHPNSVFPQSLIIKTEQLKKFTDLSLTPEYIQVFFARINPGENEPVTLVITGMDNGKSVYFEEPAGSGNVWALEHVFPCNNGMCTNDEGENVPAPEQPEIPSK